MLNLLTWSYIGCVAIVARVSWVKLSKCEFITKINGISLVIIFSRLPNVSYLPIRLAKFKKAV